MGFADCSGIKARCNRVPLNDHGAVGGEVSHLRSDLRAKREITTEEQGFFTCTAVVVVRMHTPYRRDGTGVEGRVRAESLVLGPGPREKAKLIGPRIKSLFSRGAIEEAPPARGCTAAITNVIGLLLHTPRASRSTRGACVETTEGCDMQIS